MRFTTGFIAGATIGGFVVSKMTADQRRSAARAVTNVASKIRSTQVAEAIVDGVADISGAAGERASNVVAAGTGAIADTVGPEARNDDTAEAV